MVLGSLVATPYNPGSYQAREYPLERYNAVQETRWEAYNHAYYALYNDQLDTIYPTPGFSFNPYRFQEWKKKFFSGGKAESASRGLKLTRPIVDADYPEHVWVWLYQRMLAADE